MIQALYVDPRGPYPALLGPENCWDEKRDARLYDGPHAVVAHPDCGPWGGLRHQCRRQTRDCAVRAVEQVRRFGGVLEHPAKSELWDEFGLPEPFLWRFTADKFEDLPQIDSFGGYTIAVNQCEWGHVARKATWLYIVGVPRESVERLISARPYPGREPTHWVSGRRQTQGGTERARANGWKGGAAPPGIKICSKQQRERTPVAFAEFLIAIARDAQSSRARSEL